MRQATSHPHDIHSRRRQLRSNNRGLRAHLKNQEPEKEQEETTESPVLIFEADFDEMMLTKSIRREQQRPHYKGVMEHDDSFTSDTSHSSFTSFSMQHDQDNDVQCKERRNRIEQMRADRELVARLDQENKALEQQQSKKSRNGIFQKSRRRAQEIRASVITRVQNEVTTDKDNDHRPSPGNFLKTSLTKLTNKRNNEQHIGELQQTLSQPDLPSVRFLEQQLEETTTALDFVVPVQSIREEAFEVGRGRKGIKTIRTTTTNNNSKPTTRSLSPVRTPSSRSQQQQQRRSRSPLRTSSRRRRSPVITQLDNILQ